MAVEETRVSKAHGKIGFPQIILCPYFFLSRNVCTQHDLTHILRTLLREEAAAQQTQRAIVLEDMERMGTDTPGTNVIVKQKQQILECLSPHDFQVKFRSLAEHRVPDTGHWLLESPEFQQWENGKGPTLLWLNGKGITKDF